MHLINYLSFQISLKTLFALTMESVKKTNVDISAIQRNTKKKNEWLQISDDERISKANDLLIMQKMKKKKHTPIYFCLFRKRQTFNNK